MGSDDLTIRVLLEIRDNIQATNVRLDEFRLAVDARLEAFRVSVDDRFEEVGARITAVELNLATQMTALIGSTRDLSGMLQDRFDLRERVERCERAIEDLDRRIG